MATASGATSAAVATASRASAGGAARLVLDATVRESGSSAEAAGEALLGRSPLDFGSSASEAELRRPRKPHALQTRALLGARRQVGVYVVLHRLHLCKHHRTCLISRASTWNGNDDVDGPKFELCYRASIHKQAT